MALSAVHVACGKGHRPGRTGPFDNHCTLEVASAMFSYEIQFLGRARGDYDRHMKLVSDAAVSGSRAFKSYYFAGIKGLVVFLESEIDCAAVLRAVPRGEVVGAWQIRPGMRVAA
jgi:hypothetical protein